MTPDNDPRPRVPGAAATFDFVGSVFLGAVAIWLAMLVGALVISFVFWDQPHVPGWGWFRFAAVMSAAVQLRHRFKGK